MDRPFLTLITRCCRRPKMMGEAIESALKQTDQDFEIVFIPDLEQRGIRWANCQFAKNTHRVDGLYVYTLDDDSLLKQVDLVENLKKVAFGWPGADRHNLSSLPGVIMIRSERPQLAPKLLPRKEHWGHRARLKLGSTNGGCYVSRSDWWKMYAHHYCIPAAGDWAYLRALKDNRAVTFAWEGGIIGKTTQQLGRGKKFETGGTRWWRGVRRRYKLEEVAPEDWRLRPWQGVVPVALEMDAPIVEEPESVPVVPEKPVPTVEVEEPPVEEPPPVALIRKPKTMKRKVSQKKKKRHPLPKPKEKHGLRDR